MVLIFHDLTKANLEISPVLKECIFSFSPLCSFGSKMRSPELGIIYNDQLWDAVNLWVNEFQLEVDSLKPRKRPMSLASPSIILDENGNVKMVIGAAGGKYIATALSQVIILLSPFHRSLNYFVS